MKKNRMMRLASVLLVLCLLTTSVISGTFAKYTSTVTGADKATVAKWSFKQDGNELAVAGNSETVTFDLFDTIVDTATDATDAEVAENLIAPGTKGSFQMDIVNESEVTATYRISLAENSNTIPLQFSLDGASWTDDITTLVVNGTLGMTDATKSLTKTVYWRWEYEKTANGHADQTDGYDTAAGIAAQASSEEVEVTATITFTQVD